MCCHCDCDSFLKRKFEDGSIDRINSRLVDIIRLLSTVSKEVCTHNSNFYPRELGDIFCRNCSAKINTPK